ncbi:MAG TPA: UvrD-helicase domain-containing protein, partial [Luteolibacter sp.]|nr:UvrD-helicase domain-containing protein [Luteolibacter sp.]
MDRPSVWRRMNILDKNLLILASAGSGKTYQLGNRVIGLAAKGAPPERIVALTFTRKAAGEFADSVLMKLAAAAADEKTARRVAAEIGVPAADFSEILAKVVAALPRLTLGTMDGFFAKVVRGFQYELGLTGGKFDLIEGPRAAAAREEILAEILGDRLEEGTADELLHVFRRATYGKENARVGDNFSELASAWQGRYREPRDREWGPAMLAGVAVGDWEESKRDLAAKIRRDLDSLEYTDSRQRKAVESMIDSLESHTIAGGGLGNAGTLFKNVCEVIASGRGTLEVKSYKPFIIGGPAGEALRNMVLLAAQCEMAAAIDRTRAVRGLVADFDKLCEERLR